MHTRTAGEGAAHADLPTGAILPFLLLSFGLSWALLALMVARPAAVEALSGPLGVTNPLYILAVWAPALAAAGLILMHSGPGGLRRFMGRLSPRGVAPGWWAVALLALPAVKMLGAALNGTPPSGLLVLSPPGEVLLVSAFMLILGPVEELGWRGTLLPLMQRRLAPVWAGILVGAVWAVWHIPAFWLADAPQAAWSLLPFILGVTSVGVIMAVVYNRTGGNLALAVVIHWQLNVAIWPEAQPWENYLTCALAVLLVWRHRAAMLTPGAGETVVVPR
jgi:membrane protease YdiL (CAAX protease family)